MMKNIPISLFRQVADLFPEGEFEDLVMKIFYSFGYLSFDSWTHFVSMTFCQLAHASRWREICGGLRTCV